MTAQLAHEDDLDRPRGVVDEDFFAAHHPRLVRMLERICPDRETAQDIAQETLVRAWERPDLLDPSRSAWPWLRTVARRLAVDHARGTARHLRILNERVRPEPVVDGSMEHVHMVSERDVLRRALTEVPARQRAALGLRHVLDWTPDEVAEHLGVQRNAADQLLFRARRSLRLSYERACAALWLLWPGHWGRGSSSRARALDPKVLEVGLASAPVLERALAVVVATMVAVGSAVATGGMDVAEGAMQAPAPAAQPQEVAPGPEARPPLPAEEPAPLPPPTSPVTATTDPAPEADRRTVVEVSPAAAVPPDRGRPAEARTRAEADDDGLALEHEVVSRLTVRPDDDAETESDAETGGGGGAALDCDGMLTGELCERVQALP